MRWKLSQEMYLRVHYSEETFNQMQGFINKSPKAIHEKARKLGMAKKIPNWTDEEIMILIKQGSEKASKLLNRSLNSCKIKKSRIWKLLKNN